MDCKTDWLAEAYGMRERLAEIRAFFHMNPELGNEEHVTSEKLRSLLEELGWNVTNPFGTALCAEMHFGKEQAGGVCEEQAGTASVQGDRLCDRTTRQAEGRCRVAGLRADMDALPVREATGASFESRNRGVMHACGHDVHMSCAVGAAALLAAHKDELCGSAVIFFEPDEEGSGGALRFAESGCLDGVDAVFGAHVTPDLPAGSVGIRYGKMYAASNTFRCVVKGIGAHGATPEKGIDALRAAVSAVSKLCRLPEESEDRCVVTVGTLSAGTKENTVADRAEFTGIIRTLGAKNRTEMLRRFDEVIAETERETGAHFEMAVRTSYGGIVNSERETGLAEAAARELLGDDSVVIIGEPTMTTEDFGVYIDNCGGGSFYHLGAGCTKPLHSSEFLPSENILPIGAALHAKIIADFLAAK